MIVIESKDSIEKVNWQQVRKLLIMCGLNDRNVEQLEKAFRNSAFCWFGYKDEQLIAVARAISDHTWCNYLCDVAVVPEQQGLGYGKILMNVITNQLQPFGKTFIYAIEDKIPFYRQFGFSILTTGMIFADSSELLKMHEQGYIR
ncbi:GNAT family N-acetyltransferase [Escherichia coli]|nr:GNAT family N-acetyltransferase [Escherichia coli]